MASTISKSTGPSSLAKLWQRVNSNVMAAFFSLEASTSIGNGTTAGFLRTNAQANYKIGQFAYTKASTDDLWDLSGETDTVAGEYRAYWLYLNAAGTASVAAGGGQSSAASALLDLPALTETKSIIGVFIADPACDFDDAGGLAAQGTIHDGIPDGVNIGIRNHGFLAPEIVVVES